MKLTVLGSSSAGNGYILSNGKEALILEAGIRFSTAKKALNFNTSIISGLLISHSHGDHAKYVNSYLQGGIKVLSSSSVLDGVDHKYDYLCKEVKSGQGYKIGNFRILPFDLEHDVPCLGYLVNHPETGTIMFLTDSYLCKYLFPGLSHIMLECNYADHILEQNILNGSVHPSMRPRLLQTHMELQTAKSILQANDLSQVKNIILIHLSSSNSDSKLFKDEVIRATGKNVFIAEKGLRIDINNIPY